jgi:hypothetical protein
MKKIDPKGVSRNFKSFVDACAPSPSQAWHFKIFIIQRVQNKEILNVG